MRITVHGITSAQQGRRVLQHTVLEGILRRRLAGGACAVVLVAACGSERAQGEIATNDDRLISDIARMTQESDGTFTVTCKDGSVESGVTSDEIAKQRVCDRDGSTTCVDGNRFECTDAKEHWTGTKCCVDGPVTCVDSNQFECTDPKEHWTGSRCCVER